MTIKYSICNIRITGSDKNYYLNQLKIFCSYFNSKKVLAVHFGKQDIRGTESITIIDHRHCVPAQKHFTNKWEMLGYIVGFNDCKDKGGYNFSKFLKGSKREVQLK